MSRSTIPSIVATLGVLLAIVTTAQAADTTEAFALGEINLEAYGVIGGLGGDEGTTMAVGEIAFGVGLVEQYLSVLLTTAVTGGQTLERVEGGLSIQVFGTPIDTDHIDLDIGLSAARAGPDLAQWALVPAIELNLDKEPDLAAWGGYFIVEVPMTANALSHRVPPEDGLLFAAVFTAGAYWTLAERHQLLVQLDQVVLEHSSENDRTYEIGGVTAGYNVMLSETLELLTELAVDIPQDDERSSVALMAGLIATL